jgi:hypothetical protein
MSDTGYGVSIRGDLSGEVVQGYVPPQQDPEKPIFRKRKFHDCSFRIELNDSLIYHNNGYISNGIPIISYPDGMKVGCTFITNEALGKLYDFHQEYKNRNDYLEHQSGS